MMLFVPGMFVLMGICGPVSFFFFFFLSLFWFGYMGKWRSVGGNVTELKDNLIPLAIKTHHTTQELVFPMVIKCITPAD